MNYIYLLLFLETFLFFLAFILNKKDIMAPSVVMCAMFVVSTLFAMANMKLWNIEYSIKSCFILVSGLLVYLAAETVFRMFFERRRAVTTADIDNTVYVQKWMIRAVIAFDLIMLVWYFLRLRQITGMSGFTTMIFSTYRSMTGHLESRTNTDVEQAGILLNQFLKLVKALGFAAEYILIKNLMHGIKIRKQIGLVLIVFLSVCTGLIVAQRTVLLQLVAAGAVEYSIVWHQKRGWSRNLSWKVLRIGFLLLFIGIPAFHFTTLLIGESTKLGAFGYASIYLGSSIPLFDMYVRAPTKPVVFGEETLVGLRQFLDLMGISTYNRDVNLEFRNLSEGMISNVYTFFRRPLHDFGFCGMLVFTVLVALLFSWLYYGKIKWKKPSRRTDGWILFYGYLYYWIFTSSILQVSCFYISFNTVSSILMIVISYWLMTGVRVSARGGTIVIARDRRTLEN